MTTDNRPLSPHLQVYRFEWTMAYSIIHRITGVGLAFGTIFMAYWLLALAGGAESFATAQDLAGSIIGLLLLLGWTWALFYHLANGIRHLFWDAGKGLELTSAALSGHIMVASSFILTGLAWIVGYFLI
ncbi:MAG: succinate dehydrogenase, cytochrome b556 subunit [Alphaproteobacteria bacterium]